MFATAYAHDLRYAKVKREEDALQNLWDKTWRNKKGRVVLWQMPNAYLIAWAIFSVLSLLFNSHTADVFSWAGSAALIIWCVLEILKGVNYFRRVLGLLVMVYAIMSLIKSL